MKLVLLGEGRVGKTSIVNRWVNNVFDPDQPSTVDAQMYVKKKLFVDGKSVEIALWDTAGQERYHALGPLYYRNADGAILVYDCTDEDTFDRVRRWIKELQKAANPNIQIVICGNKADREKERQIPEAKANTFAKKYSAEHFSTSAKTNLGVDEAFLHLIRSVVAVKEGRLAGSGIDGDNGDLFGNMGLGGGDDEGASGSGSPNGKKKKSGGRLKIVDDSNNNNDGGDENNNNNSSDYAYSRDGPDVSASGTKIGGSRITNNSKKNNLGGGRNAAETDEWLSSTRGGDDDDGAQDEDASGAEDHRYSKKKSAKKSQGGGGDDDEDTEYTTYGGGGGRNRYDDDADEEQKPKSSNKKQEATKKQTKTSDDKNDRDDLTNNNNGETDYSIDDGSNWNSGSASSAPKTVQKQTPATAQSQQQQKPKTINLAEPVKAKPQEDKKCSC